MTAGSATRHLPKTTGFMRVTMVLQALCFLRHEFRSRLAVPAARFDTSAALA